MIYLAAKGNDENNNESNDTQDYAIALMRNLYRSYHRQEYIKALRERGLPFGYIHSVNIEKNIRQIYEDTCIQD